MYLLCACPHDGKPNVSQKPPPLNFSVQGQFDSGVSGIFIPILVFLLYPSYFFLFLANFIVNASVDDIRQSIRYRRRRLGAGFKSRAALALVNKVKASSVYQRSRHIALYLENDGELSCRPLIKQIWKDGKCCYLPVLASKQASPPMRFSMYHPGSILVKNRYGIFEPAGTQGRLPKSLDLVLMPLVAFDAMGHRIGMGGGYYDRSFAFKAGVGKSVRAKKAFYTKAPFLMGVAYRFQKVKSINPQAWDVRPDRVLAV